ncbi:MAG TPA: ProQ/FinO family protein [Methylibium sp.]|nr:ProQ/FinO family protein [Methylibium sp.]
MPATLPETDPAGVLPAPDAHDGDPGPAAEAVTGDAAPAAPANDGAAEAVGLSPADTAKRLAELFPAVFAPGAARPLKLRIQADIQQRAPGVFSRKALSVVLHRHTTSTAYLRALAAATERTDLDGQPAGPLADEHREAARVELQRRREVHEQRRAAEREVQRRTETEARRHQQAQARADAQAVAERAALLRAFEGSTLTRANFCALKGLAEPQLEALLAQAREDRTRARAPSDARTGPDPRRHHAPRRPR